MFSLRTVCIITLAATPLAAQRAVPAAIDRGSLIVAGDASFSRITAEYEGVSPQVSFEETVTAISVRPAVLWFIAPRVAMGGSLFFGRGSSDQSSNTSWMVGPSARVYVGGDDRVLPYLGLAASIGRTAFSRNGGPDTDGTSKSLDAFAGLTWLLASHVGLVTEAFVARERTDFEVATGGEAEQSRASFGLRVGFATFLTRSR